MNLEKLKSGSDLDGDSGHPMDRLPDWMDMEKFRRGREFFQRHSAAATLALHCSLTVGFVVNNLIEPLVFNRASDTPAKAFRRYMETFVHVVLWHTADVWDACTPSLGHRSLAFVRSVHGRVARAMNSQLRAKESGEAVEEKWRYVSQYDMAIVQAGFFAGLVMYPAGFGVLCTRDELDDYVFFWRGIGYLLGVRDDYNICSEGLASAHSICRSIDSEIIARGLLQPPRDFQRMSDAYVDGLNTQHSWLRVHSKESIIGFYQCLTRCGDPTWLKLTWSDHLRVLWLRGIVFMIRYFPGFERMANFFTMRLFTMLLPLVQKQLNRCSDQVGTAADSSDAVLQ